MQLRGHRAHCGRSAGDRRVRAAAPGEPAPNQGADDQQHTSRNARARREQPAVTQTPDGITLKRNRDLQGPGAESVATAGAAGLRRRDAAARAAQRLRPGPHDQLGGERGARRLSVTAPNRLRGGLIFQVRVKVVARREIKQLQLDFDEGWWESMSDNSIQPEPSSENSPRRQIVPPMARCRPAKRSSAGSTSRSTRRTSASAARMSRCRMAGS